MRLHLVLDVSPEDEKRPASSEILLETLEAELESGALDIDGRVYAVTVLGSGKSHSEAMASVALRQRK